MSDDDWSDERQARRDRLEQIAEEFGWDPWVLAAEIERLRAELAQEREYVRALQAVLGIKVDE